MDKNKRTDQILKVIKEIEKSPLSVNQYFKEHDTPFGHAQYYSYKKILKESGIDGLVDKRNKGNHLKFTDEIKSYVTGLLDSKQFIKSSEVQDKIKNKFKVAISITAINKFRRENNISWIRPKKEEDRQSYESGASEIVIAFALHTGLISSFSDFINHSIEEKRNSKEFKQSDLIEKDHLGQRAQGKFTSIYNQLPQVRESRFKSIDEKVSSKRFDSMRIFNLSQESIKRYCLALFSLPLVTGNGRSRSINTVKGNALKYLCGFNYKAASLDKHIRELKYLQLSNGLIETTAKFWLNFWSNRGKTDSIFACYYIDGNTKALWSSKPCYKGKVTMHGRVMNSIEQLFIHDGQGHPIYFKTFNGHADLGKNGLNMIDEITKYLNHGSSSMANQFAVNRVLIMDGGGNAVKILRKITDYYYITILDSNQVTERKIKSISEESRYEYGSAYLIDSKIELEDSNDKGYIFETRAVQVRWDNGKVSTLITNLSKDIFSADNVVKSYFDRWPKQELDFKDMKNGVNIHRMVGYGKKLVENTKVIEKIEVLQKQIKVLEHKLSIPLSTIKSLEKELQPLITKETSYREKSKLVEGSRKFNYKKEVQNFKSIQKQIGQISRKIKVIRHENYMLFKSLGKKKAELARIIDKKKRYYVDVELDQLMTCFKISFANICSYLLDECFEGKKMTLQKLFESIFDLHGAVTEAENQREIYIKPNPKQPDVMRSLKEGFEVINNLKIKDLRGFTYNFKFCM